MQTLELLKEVLNGIEKTLDVNSVIGEPISGEHLTVIPISKMTVGFGSGGGEIENKNMKKDDLPIGAVGGGATIYPLGFLVLDGFDVKFIKTTGGDKWSETLDGLSGLFSR